jgi:hypothetical protein
LRHVKTRIPYTFVPFAIKRRRTTEARNTPTINTAR